MPRPLCRKKKKMLVRVGLFAVTLLPSAMPLALGGVFSRIFSSRVQEAEAVGLPRASKIVLARAGCMHTAIHRRVGVTNVLPFSCIYNQNRGEEKFQPRSTRPGPQKLHPHTRDGETCKRNNNGATAHPSPKRQDQSTHSLTHSPTHHLKTKPNQISLVHRPERDISSQCCGL